MTHLSIGTSNIIVCGKCITLQRKKIKTLRLKIEPRTAELICSVPEHLSIEKVRKFIETHLDWIETNQAKILQKQKSRMSQTGQNELCLFGQRFTLTKKQANRFSYKIIENEIVLQVRNFSADEFKRCCDLLYAKELNRFVESILPELERQMQETVASINYRTMKTKLGSCKPSERKITLNTQIARFSKDCVRMVLIHEMVHFKEFYHNERFKKFMTTYCPNWKELRQSIKQQL